MEKWEAYLYMRHDIYELVRNSSNLGTRLNKDGVLEILWSNG